MKTIAELLDQFLKVEDEVLILKEYINEYYLQVIEDKQNHGRNEYNRGLVEGMASERVRNAYES